MENSKKSFIVRKKYRKQIELLDNEKAWMLFKAIMKMQDWEVLENTDPVISMLLSIMEEERKEDNEKYEEVCNKNRENVKKRWEKKQVQNDTTVYDRIPLDTKNTDNDNDYDSDNIKKKILKEKEQKKKYLDFVLLTDDEYWKLLNIFWQQRLNLEIQKLNNYIWSKWRKYKSHYFTIRQRNQDFIQEKERREKELNTTQHLDTEEDLLWTIVLKR